MGTNICPNRTKWCPGALLETTRFQVVERRGTETRIFEHFWHHFVDLGCPLVPRWAPRYPKIKNFRIFANFKSLKMRVAETF